MLLIGNTLQIIYLKEIVVASLGLLLVPRNIQINVEDFFAKNLYLPVGAAYELENNTDTIYKLNTVSETINQMSKTYSEKEEDPANKNKERFIEEIEEKISTMKDSILYDELSNTDNGIIEELYEILAKKESITKDDIINVFEKRNEYVLGYEDFDTNLKIEEDINKTARLMNDTYKIIKVNSIWKQKINENKKVISNQLDGVSKMVSDVAKSIEKTSKEFEEEAKEIKILCLQKDIEVLDINIKKGDNNRFIVNLYKSSCKEDEECKIKDTEKILSKVLKDDVCIQKETCGKEGKQNLCKQIYVSKDKYSVQIGIAHEKKNGSAISGDYSNQTKLDDGKYLIALSDGMGSGPEARKSSQIAVKMLTRLLSSRI